MILVHMNEDLLVAGLADDVGRAVTSDLLRLAVPQEDSALAVRDVDPQVQVIQDGQQGIHIQWERFRHHGFSEIGWPMARPIFMVVRMSF
jgi:hypothetical protein